MALEWARSFFSWTHKSWLDPLAITLNVTAFLGDRARPEGTFKRYTCPGGWIAVGSRWITWRVLTTNSLGVHPKL